MADIYLYNNKMWKVKYDFRYTGNSQSFNLPRGEYLCICKGARGGHTTGYQNKGGCAYGILNLEAPLTAYAVVGGDGTGSVIEDDTYVIGEGGYNGGGNGGKSSWPATIKCGAGGGGASDIRLSNEAPHPGTIVHQIPDGYDEVEYVESNRTQYIDLGINHTANTRMEIICNVHANTGSDYQSLFGARNSPTVRAMTLFTRFLNADNPWYGCGTQETRGYDFVYDDWIKIIVDRNVVSWYDMNDQLISSITGSTLADGQYPMYLFDLDEAGRPYPDINCKVDAKISSFKMYDGDTLVRYMVPFTNNGTELDLSNVTFEQGTIGAGGRDESSNTRIRSVGYIPYIQGDNYIKIDVTGSTTLMVNIMTYRSNGTVIDDMGWVASGVVSHVDVNTRYIRICLRKSNQSNIVPSDLSTISARVWHYSAHSGMYDLVEGNFYYDSAGGEFEIGSPVAQKTIYSTTELVDDGLLTRIMVAGGGGGENLTSSDNLSDFTGYGGGVYGGYPHSQDGFSNNKQAPSQTDGYAFGKGQSGVNRTTVQSPIDGYGISGAGGGWFGGYASGSATSTSSGTSANGGGGSGYILTSTSYRPSGYLPDISRTDIEFTNTLMTSGLAQESCVIICEPVDSYSAGDRIICDCIGSGTRFPLFIGEYNIKCAGGYGGHRLKSSRWSLGGYAEGVLKNPALTEAFAYVGGSGTFIATDKSAGFVQSTHPTHCFNGGQISQSGYVNETTGGQASGGGTDLRIGTDSLYARVIVAGAGGGSGRFSSSGGNGGGDTGSDSTGGYSTAYYGPGTQTGPGAGSNTEISGGFGYGGMGLVHSGGYGGSGGGGWYGGSGLSPDGSNDDDGSGAGGSGYVLTELSYKPEGYLLDENYYLTHTSLVQGGASQLYDAPITGIVISVIDCQNVKILAHDSQGFKYYDSVNQEWVFLKESGITVNDFNEYGIMTFVSDAGLSVDYEIYGLDGGDSINTFDIRTTTPPGKVSLRYRTPHMMSKYNIDADVDSSAVDFSITAKRTGVAEDAYINFDIDYDIRRTPSKPTRVYCILAYTTGSASDIGRRPPDPKEPAGKHLDLLPIGSATRMPARFKNYIGSFINTSEAITTINSAVVCEHNRCIYSATLCNNSVVRFAKLNLVTNTSTIIKDIPKTNLGNTFYGDIKVDDNYIYLSCGGNNTSTRTIWRTPNSSDTTVTAFTATSSNNYNFQAFGKMEWYDNHTLVILGYSSLIFFDTEEGLYRYVSATSGTQSNSRRDMIIGKDYIISLYDGTSSSAYVIDKETFTWRSLKEYYDQEFVGTEKNCGCYHDGTFYIVQRNRLHFLDEETMTITNSVPTPFTDIDPKTVVYGDGILYILIQNTSTLYMYNIETNTFYAAGLPFKIDNWTADGWIRSCAYRGYCFIPQIRLYTINFVNRAKYNLGYKYDQFVIVTNSENAEDPDNRYVYDDRFVTFTEDNMTINNEGDNMYEMIEIDPTNHIKMCSISKNDYKEIISATFTHIESEDEEETEET